MTRILITVGALALLAACHKPHPATARATPPGVAAPAAVTATSLMAASDFVQQADFDDTFETLAGRLALAQSGAPAVRAFAQATIDDAARSAAALKAAIARSNQALTLSSAFPSEMQITLADLKEADRETFDRKFMNAQVDAHQKALTLMTGYASHGDMAVLKAFAAASEVVSRRHLERARSIEGGLN